MKFNFCSNCGAALKPARDIYHSQKCARCGTEHWQNAKPCAGALVEYRGRVLLARRGVEPYKDRWDIPGGFLFADELPEAGTVREVFEETGLRIRIKELLGIYTDRYGDDAHSEFTLTLYYLAQPLGGTKHLRAQDDVSELRWFAPNELPQEFAFAHERAVLKKWKSEIGKRKTE